MPSVPVSLLSATAPLLSFRVTLRLSRRRNAPPREAYTVLMAMAACAMGLLVVRELRRRAAVHPEGFAALLRRFGVGRGRGGVRPEGSVSERGASEGPRGVEGEVAGAVEGEGEEEDEGGVGEGESGSAVEQAEDGERRYSEGGAMY